MNDNWNHLILWLNKKYPNVLEHYKKHMAGEEE